jgi:DNA-binding CsgD family transcriptional regulator
VTVLAVSFGWAWGLHDWQIAQALGISEYAVRTIRRGLGLKRGAGGVPV